MVRHTESTVYAIVADAPSRGRPTLKDGSVVVRTFENGYRARRVTAFLPNVELVRHADLSSADRERLSAPGVQPVEPPSS